jgi:hypothetical protein
LDLIESEFEKGPLASDRQSPLLSDEDGLGRPDDHAANGGYPT